MTGAQPRDHYEVLGVSRSARIEEIRRAYRTLARDNHPDRHGGRTTPEMVRINEAWRILSDPQRRRQYDESFDPTVAHRHGESNSQVPPTTIAVHTPARFPWKFVVGFFAVATVVILVLGAFTDAGPTPPIDNIIRVGSCIDVNRHIQEAWEVPCDGPHDAQVVSMVPFDGVCPGGTETFRDRQGLGLVCSAR